MKHRAVPQIFYGSIDNLDDRSLFSYIYEQKHMHEEMERLTMHNIADSISSNHISMCCTCAADNTALSGLT